MELSGEKDECLCWKTELHKLLDEGLSDYESGNGRPAEEVFADIKEKYGFEELM